VVRLNISQKFLALPRPKYSRAKGGDVSSMPPSKTQQNAMKMPLCHGMPTVVEAKSGKQA
jgi:hypothetical protein